MSWKDELDPTSLRIAMTDASPLRVLAGPGTGKTYTLIRRVARLLEEGVPPKRILVSTFTRTAAADLKHELEELDVDGASSVRATTVHSLCFSVLNRNEVLDITGRVPRPLLNFETRFLLEDLKDENFGDIYKRQERLKAFEAAWARLQNDRPGWAFDAIDLQFEERLRSWLEFHEAMLIGELVPEALSFLQNNPLSPEHSDFSHIFVDEYQDLNASEQTLIALLARNAKLTIIGDEDQSIYSFKYAHPEGIAEFRDRHPETTDETLKLCRRCPSNVVDIANSFISNNSERTKRELSPNPENGVGEIYIAQWDNMAQEAEELAKRIVNLVEAGRIEPGQVLVLAPRREIGQGVRNAVRAKGVQAHSFFQEEPLDGNPKDLEKCETQQAFTLLTLLASLEDNVALRCWCGFGSPNLRQKAWARIQTLCIEHDLTLPEALRRIQSGKLKLASGHEIIKRLNELETRLQELAPFNGRELLDALFPDNNPAFNQIRTLATDLNTDADAKQLLEHLRTNITQPEPPTDVDFVRVMSLHKSKGLTADLVIVMGCIQGLIPHFPKDASKEERRLNLNEQRRLFYVSITRARKILVLSSVTELSSKEAHRMLVDAPHRRGRVRTITSQFIRELGPNCPIPISGVNLPYGDYFLN